MNLLIDAIMGERTPITYRPEFNQITGAVTATILLQQVWYRYKNNNRKAFYKFKQPCSHKAYKEGDSWCEELGFTRKEFDSAIKKIATKINKGGEKVENTIIWYWTDNERMTWYEVNEKYLQNILSNVFLKTERDFTVKTERDFTKSTKGTLHIHTENTPKKTTKSLHDFSNFSNSNNQLNPVVEEKEKYQQPKKISPSYERKGTTSKIDYSQLQNNFTFRDKNIPRKELITFLCKNNKELVKMGGMYSKVDKKGKIKFLERFASINATKKAWKNENDCLEHFINYCNQNK